MQRIICDGDNFPFQLRPETSNMATLNPYPASLPTDEALNILIAALRGQPVDVPAAVHVGWVAVGYGLSQGFPPTPQAVAPMTAEEAADALESCCGDDAGKLKSFDWLSLLPILLDLIKKLIGG